ncbi:MAG: hypothetical protein LAO77_01585 [Acidobacteriia bacterium]|nr:hypothetical protein [Terriglobia bacterium]
MNRTTVVVGVVAIVVLGTFATRRTTRILAGGGKADIDVLLSMQNGVCAAQNPEALGGAWFHKVKWHVTNRDCDAPQYVAFQVYRPHLEGGGLGSPAQVIDPDPAYSGSVARGAPAVTVDGRVAKFHVGVNDVAYKYQICVGPTPNPTTNCLDPDVDVWPF